MIRPAIHEARHAWHQMVGNYQIDRRADPEQFKRACRLRLDYVVAEILQHCCSAHAHKRIVVDHENLTRTNGMAEYRDTHRHAGRYEG
jgi:hypothetical protein